MHEDSDVRHENSFFSNGFTIIPNDIITRGDLSIGAKLVYGYLSHLAWRAKAAEAKTPIGAMCRDLGVSEPTIRGYIKELANAPSREADNPANGVLLTVKRRGLGLSNVYTLFDPKPRAQESSVPTERNPQIPTRAGSLLEEDEELREEQPPVTPPSTDLTTRDAAHPVNRPGKVNRKPVKDSEYELAAFLLDNFNQATGSRYTSSEWISKIICRIREHPEIVPMQHLVVIQSVLMGKRWWDGDPSPSIVYGNAALFERNLHAAERPPDPNRPLTSDDMRRISEERSNTIDGTAVEVVDA